METLKKNIQNDGFALIENLFTPRECDQMIEEMRQLTKNIDNKSKFMFRASNKDGPQLKAKYFIDSAHKISFFYEEQAVDADGKLCVEHEYLGLNKVGHALHSLNPTFKKYTFDERIRNICENLELIEPVVCQSMFIFKNPKIGGEVCPHQDASYLYTEPQSLYGIWIALEDATLENGCLWFEKGSHKGDLHKRFIRNPDANSEQYTIYTGKDPEYNFENYTPVPVKKGTCVVIHGKVYHFSKPNTSKCSRNIYTFHIFDRSNTNYSPENWIQPEENSPFPSVYRK